MNSKNPKNRNNNRSTIVQHNNTSNINSKSQNVRQNKPSNERTVTPEGVYCNGRVMHVTTSLVGCIVQIEVKDGIKYEGVLRTFSPDYELVVDYVAKLEPNNTQNTNSSIGHNVVNLLSSLQANNSVSPTIIFKFCDVVKLTASNVDLDYATNKGQLLTDTEISKHDGRQLGDKELVPWEGEDNAEYDDRTFDLDTNISVQKDGINGWAPEDMFAVNEQKYNVKSTYDSSLKDYTMPLSANIDEQKQAQAQKIADEIESDPKTSENLNKENTANDEEERFSAVSRPPNDNAKQHRQPYNRDRRNPNPNQSNYNNPNSNVSNSRLRSSQNVNSNVSVSSPPFQSKPTHNAYNKHNSNNSSTSSSSSYPAYNKSNHHQNYREENTEPTKPQQYANVVAANTYSLQYSSKPDPDETPPNTGHTSHAHHSAHSAPPNQHPLPQRVRPPPNKRKEDVAESLKKFSVDFKLPSNVVESSSKENTKSDTHTKTNNSSKNKTSNECPQVKDKLEVNNDKELGENKVLESTTSSVSSESELAKKSTLNPNAKTFTPRSPLAPVNTSSTPPSVASTPSSTVSSVHMAPQMPQHHHQHHQQQQHQQQPRFQNPLVQLQTQYNVLPPGLTLPLGPNQYLMTNVQMTPTFTQQNASQQSRSFRNKGPQQYTNHGMRHEFAQPSHVAAQVTGHPVLATAPISAPQQLPVSYATQQTTGMVTPPGPQAMYQHMYSGFHPRMNMNVLPSQAAAMGMMQHAVQYDPNLQHIYTAAGTVQLQHLVSQAQAHQHMTNSGPHSAPTTPQSGTPTTPLHGGPAPSPVHHQPNQPPTPTPQQAVMYANVSSPHAPQSGGGVGHSNSGAHSYHHAQPQLVIIPSGQAVPQHHSSGHGQLHAHALSHNATPGNHHGGPPQLMPLQLISNSAQGLTTYNPNPGV